MVFATLQLGPRNKDSTFFLLCSMPTQPNFGSLWIVVFDYVLYIYDESWSCMFLNLHVYSPCQCLYIRINFFIDCSLLYRLRNMEICKLN